MNETEAREAWLENRKRGLGGTDIAAICGLNPYKKPIDVYLGKRGLIEENPQNAAMTWGIREEPIIAAHYADLHGVKLLEPGFMVHSKHDWIVGTPDRLIEGQEKGLEIKTASLRVAHQWGEDGTDQVPDAYLIQCAWYMVLTAYPVWDVAVKIDSADYREYTVLRNPSLESRLIEIAGEFWHKHILPGVPPEPDGSDQYVKYIQASHPKDSGEMIVETPETRALAGEYAQARAALKLVEERKEMIENQIKAIIGEASGIEGNGWKFTWKSTKDSVKVDYAIALDVLQKDLGVDPELVKKATSAATFTTSGVRRIYFKASDDFCLSIENAADRAA